MAVRHVTGVLCDLLVESTSSVSFLKKLEASPVRLCETAHGQESKWSKGFLDLRFGNFFDYNAVLFDSQQKGYNSRRGEMAD